VPAACVNQVVRIGDVLEWKSLSDNYRQRASAGGGDEVRGGLLLGLAGEVIAAEQSDCHVVEQHGPEGKGGSVLPAGVSGDDRTDLADDGGEIDVVGEGDLDNPVDASRRDRPHRDSLDRRRLPGRTAVPARSLDQTLVAPGPQYYLIVAVGLIAALAIPASTLPMLSRITGPEAARFD